MFILLIKNLCKKSQAVSGYYIKRMLYQMYMLFYEKTQVIISIELNSGMETIIDIT